MLVIRAAQVEAMQKELERCFLMRHLGEIRSMHSAFDSEDGDSSLMDELQCSMQVGRRYGLQGDADLLAFIKLAIVVSPRFDLYEPAQEILSSSAIANGERMTVLLARMTVTDWLRAASAHESVGLQDGVS